MRVQKAYIANTCTNLCYLNEYANSLSNKTVAKFSTIIQYDLFQLLCLILLETNNKYNETDSIVLLSKSIKPLIFDSP